jgi:hypothetical protein
MILDGSVTVVKYCTGWTTEESRLRYLVYPEISFLSTSSVEHPASSALDTKASFSGIKEFGA